MKSLKGHIFLLTYANQHENRACPGLAWSPVFTSMHTGLRDAQVLGPGCSFTAPGLDS